MMESRSAYGYYGSAGGYTGENDPNRKDHYTIKTYYFLLDNVEVFYQNRTERKMCICEFRAKNVKNAEKHAKKWCKDYGYKFIREATKEDKSKYAR